MTKKKNTTKDLPEEKELSIEEVFNVLDFAKSYATGQLYPGAITPQLLSSAMKDISFTPKELTEDDLTNALKDPKNSESELRQFMEHLEIVSMPVKKILNYMLSQLAFDLTYTVNGALEETDYKSPAYKKSEKMLQSFLDDFNYLFYFKNAVKQMLRNETYVFCPRDDGEKIVLQELPLDRCYITGRWDYGFLVSFDFQYFLQPGVDIRFFPKFFRDKYNELFSGKESEYIPPINPDKRGGLTSRFAWYVDLPPDVAWVFKFDTSLTAAVPYFSGLLPEFIQQPTMRALQKNINMAVASRMILGQVPMRTDSRTSVKDMIAIDAITLGKFLALVQSAISEAIKITAAPLQNMKSVEFKAENDVYDEFLKTGISSSGANSAIVYSSDLKANAIESQLSFQSDSKIMEALYEQFNLFMEYQINVRTDKSAGGGGHKFSPRFEGNDYYLDRQQRFDYAMGMVERGIVLPQKIAAARGMKPHELIRMMTEAKAQGFVDMLTPVSLASQQEKDTGRPKKKDSELNDSGVGTRGEAANIAKGGKE